MKVQPVRRAWLAVLIAAVVLLAGVLAFSAREANGGGGRSDTATATGTDSETGLAWIGEDQLPAEGRETLALIDRDGPFRYSKDGATFGNFEGILPKQGKGFYAEYTVPTPGESDRGARRIVTGGGESAGSGSDIQYFYTDDHYETFSRIRR